MQNVKASSWKLYEPRPHGSHHNAPGNRQMALMSAARSGASLDPARLTAQIYERCAAQSDTVAAAANLNCLLVCPLRVIGGQAWTE